MMSHFLPLCSMTVFLFLLLIISPAIACDRCVHLGKVGFFGKASALQSGACGYGSLATSFYGGRLAAAVPAVYKDGAGCGACFTIRCKNPKICTESGTTMIVTDLNQSNETDFVLSSRAFGAMAKQGMDRELFKLGIVDVEFKRVPCEHKRNLAFRVEESSQKPHYLAVKVLYQGGQTEIVALDVAQVSSNFKKTILNMYPNQAY
ncbi:OLC1v1036519C2 [Oldenlandia corymbosa var. corymbosa]|uniref:OLC1v1036519C2 n=1 Tax=Oldenlandia corymbosa var. corymbosa TaxID=529605 RepID=A0AAV1CX06_OLDCO|nr:OLC1v1036519C2 [Oldenlandia corymbosa var. corymbosa]